MEPVAVHAKLRAARARRGQKGPDLTNVRRYLKGKTHQVGKTETRGVKKTVSKNDCRRLNATRKRLCTQADSEWEVHWQDIIDETPGVEASVSTVCKAFKEHGYDVKWRTARSVMPLTKEVKEDRRRWRPAGGRQSVCPTGQTACPTGQTGHRLSAQQGRRGCLPKWADCPAAQSGGGNPGGLGLEIN